MGLAMKRCTIIALAVACGSPAIGQVRRDPPADDRQPAIFRGYANPSAVIAAELALSRDAAARGEWTALAAAGAADSILFTPRLAWAQPLLKGRPNPPRARRWQPFGVWSSCDGSLVVSRGAWIGADGQAGPYARLWQRQGDGRYRWLVSQEAAAGPVTAEPEMIAGHVADCPVRPRRGGADEGEARRDKPAKAPRIKDLPPLDPDHRAGAAPDGTLKWDARIAPDGAQDLSISWTTGGREQAIPAG